MYIVRKAFDDKTATLMDLNDCRLFFAETSEMVASMNAGNQIIGARTNRKTITDLVPYDCMQFPTEMEASLYCVENRITQRKIEYINGIWWLFYKNHQYAHVDYYVVTYRGDEITYLTEKGYTPYIQGAKTFSKTNAYKKAATLTKRTKTGTYWKALRVECQ